MIEFLDGGKPPLAGYEATHSRLIDFFRWRGLRDPETYADRTLDRVARKLEEGEQPRADEPLRYVLGVARFIYLEGTKAETKSRTVLEDELPRMTEAAKEGPEDTSDLEACLGSLHDNERRILLVYHKGEGQTRIRGRKALAEELGVQPNALRIRVHRLRQRMETCVKNRRADVTDPADSPPGAT